MSQKPKKGFTAFLRPPEPELRPEPTSEIRSEPRVDRRQAPPATPETTDRVQYVTSTGRVRTYTASRSLPGVTLRLSEERWEKLKMLSVQERRPIQEILGEAVDDFMRGRGLPW